MAYMSQRSDVLDRHIRSELHTYLRRTRIAHVPSSMLIDELTFTVGRQEGRADVVLVDDRLHCYEIKSDGDKLTRLSKIQIKLYSKVMDFLSVVVTPKHLTSVKRRVPATWGIYTFENNVIQQVRAASISELVEPRALAGLLWKDRALQLLSDNGLERGFSNKPKWRMHDFIAEQIDMPVIRDAVCLQLKSHRRSL